MWYVFCTVILAIFLFNLIRIIIFVAAYCINFFCITRNIHESYVLLYTSAFKITILRYKIIYRVKFRQITTC